MPSFLNQTGLEHDLTPRVDAIVKSIAFGLQADAADAKAGEWIPAFVPHDREAFTGEQAHLDSANQLRCIVRMNSRSGFRIESRQNTMQVGNRPLIRPAPKTDAQLLGARRALEQSFDESTQVREHWRDNGAEVLMSGRIGDTIEFYYLDTAPMLRFVLESGSGHAIDLKPTYVYP